MTQEFIILSVDTSLIDKKIIVTTNNNIDPNSIDDIHIEIMERSSRTQLMYTLAIKGNILEVNLTEWPLPNSSYIFFLKTLKNIVGEELRTGIRRKIEFNSEITKEVKIISPVMHQEIKSLDVTLEYSENTNIETDEESKIKTCTYIEVSTDNVFHNVINSTRIYNDEITHTFNVDKEGQLFIRARIESDDEKNFQYSKWSTVISFILGKPECKPEPDEEEDFIPEIDDMSPVIDDFEDFDLELITPYGSNNGELIFLATKPINEKLFNPNFVIVTSKRGFVRTMCTIVDTILTVKMLEPLKENSNYTIKILNLMSVVGDKLNKDFKYATRLKPLYCEVEDITSLIGDFKISDEVILYHIHEASKFADYLSSTSLYPFEIDEDDVPFRVRQLVKYYAAHECLLRHTVDLASNTGLKGTVGNVTFEERETTKDISKLLKHFCDEVDKWKDAVKGYENEGRARMTTAVKGRYSNPTMQPLGLIGDPTYGRGDIYGQ